MKNTLLKSRILKAGLPERNRRSGQKTDARHKAVIYAYRQKGQKYPCTAINCRTGVPEPLFINLTPLHISTVKGLDQELCRRQVGRQRNIVHIAEPYNNV